MLLILASAFAHQTVMFCKRMHWWALEALLGKYIKQLTFGVSEEMLQLVEIPGVKAVCVAKGVYVLSCYFITNQHLKGRSG